MRDRGKGKGGGERERQEWEEGGWWRQQQGIRCGGERGQRKVVEAEKRKEE